MFRKHSVIFSLTASLLLAAAALAQDAPQNPAQEQAKERPAEVFFAPQEMAPLTFSFGSDNYLGVYLEEVNAARVKELNLSEERGAVIMKVAEGSPAEKAGLKANDVIVSFNGRRVDTVRELQRLLSDVPAGRAVTFEVLRGGSSQTISATLGKRSFSTFGGNDGELFKRFERDMQQGQLERENAMKKLQESLKDRQLEFGKVAPLAPNFGAFNFNGLNFFSGSRLGMSVESMSEQLASYFGVKEGVLVTEVREESAAAKAGLKAGDVITEVDGQKITGINDLMTALAKKTEGTLAVRFVRKGAEQTVNVTIERREARPPLPRKRAFVFSPSVNVV